MHNRMKVVSALALASLLAVGATGCSTQPAESSKTITMWTFSSTGALGLQAAAKVFEKETGTKVKVEVTSPREAYTTKIQAAARTKKLPDILTFSSGSEEFNYAASGYLVDLKGDVDAKWKSTFLPGMISTATLTQDRIDASAKDSQNSLKSLKTGSIYGIPYLGGSSGVIVANKKTLAAAGVSTTTPPATWEELVASVRKTHAASPDTGGIINGLSIPEGTYQWLYRAMAAQYLGADALKALQTKDGYTDWTGKNALNSLTNYGQMQPYWAPGVLSLNLDEADTAFSQGQAAWDVGGTYTIPSLVNQGMNLDNLMIFPVPGPKDSIQKRAAVSAFALLGASVTTQSKNKTAAVDFVRFLTTPKGAILFAEGAQDVPSVAIDPAKLVNSPLLAKVIGSLSTDPKNAFSPDDTSADPVKTPPVKHDVAVALAKLVSGEGTPESVAVTIRDIYKAAWNAQ